jgi:hypothetical protein
MKKNELRSTLINKGISRSYYSLEGGLPNEKLCLDYENGKWVVYYSERGIRSGIQYFDNEDDACDHLLHAIEESASGKY